MGTELHDEFHCKYLTVEKTLFFFSGSDLKSCRASLRKPNGDESELPKRATPLTRSVAKRAARLGLSIIRQVSNRREDRIRELIPDMCFITKVNPLKLFLEHSRFRKSQESVR